MRYDTPIYLQAITEGAYDPTTGDYGPETVTETIAYASVSGTKISTMHLVYGEIKEGSITVHLQNKVATAFSRIRIGSKVYAVDYRIPFRVKEAFVLSEVQ